MQLNKDIIIQCFKEECNEKFPNWAKGKISIAANSGATQGLNRSTQIYDENGGMLKQVIMLDKCRDYFIDFFKEANKNDRINKIELTIEDKERIEVKAFWDQAVVDEFENFLPKSRKEKIKAWYLPDKDLNEITNTRNQLLPTINYKPAINNLTIQKAMDQLLPFVRQNSNPLIEAGVIYIKKFRENEYSGSVTFFEYENEQDLETRSPNEIEYELPITPEIVTIYEFLQKKTIVIKDNIQWNELYIQVNRDGSYEATFESDGVSVNII